MARSKKNVVQLPNHIQCAKIYAQDGLEGALKIKRNVNFNYACRKVDGRTEVRIVKVLMSPKQGRCRICSLPGR